PAGAARPSGAPVRTSGLRYPCSALAARTLRPGAHGQTGVRWAGRFIGRTVLFRPLAPTTTRAVAERLAHGTEVKTVVRSVAAVYITVLVVGGVGAGFAWGTITSRLFLGNNLLTAMLFGGTALYGLEYMLRGV